MTTLAKQEQKTLLQLARLSIENKLKNGTHPPDTSQFTITDNMKKQTACFVTLHLQNKLRGCIGSTIPIGELYETVLDMAVKSAYEDQRFKPITKQELDQTQIDISVLSEAQEIYSFDAIEIGKHGVIIEHNNQRAVFLPQVATQFNWDYKELLSQLSKKADLPEDAWEHADSLYTFTTQSFSE